MSNADKVTVHRRYAVTVTGIAIHRFEGDQIQESWDCYDALGLLQQRRSVPRWF